MRYKCLYPREGNNGSNFYYVEIGIHRRIFIITLDTNNSQKYPYTYTIMYRTKEALSLYFQPNISSPTKRICMKGTCCHSIPLRSVRFAPAFACPFTLNISHRPQHVISKLISGLTMCVCVCVCVCVPNKIVQ